MGEGLEVTPRLGTHTHTCMEEVVCEVTVEEIDSNFMRRGNTGKDGQELMRCRGGGLNEKTA